MLTNHQAKTKTGDCEASHFDGLGENLKVTLTSGNMWLCDACLAKEERAYQQEKAATAFINYFKQADQTLEVKTDVFNAYTPALVELRAAIEHNESIPAEEKDYVYCEHVEAHVKHLDDVIFGLQKELSERQNERRVYQTNGQQFAGKLRAEKRERFAKTFDVSYAPKPAVVKPPKTKAPVIKHNTKEAQELAEKYGLEASSILMMAKLGKGTSLEDAARALVAMKSK